MPSVDLRGVSEPPPLLAAPKLPAALPLPEGEFARAAQSPPTESVRALPPVLLEVERELPRAFSRSIERVRVPERCEAGLAGWSPEGLMPMSTRID